MAISIDSTVYNSLEALSKEIGDERTIATVGFFDGVHLGHQDLLQTLVKEAKVRSSRSLVVTFAQHPMTVVAKPNQDTPKLICSLKQKIRYLKETGIDLLLVLPFTREFAAKDGATFAKELHTYCHTDLLLMGYDNHFGSKRFPTRAEANEYLKTWCIPTVRHKAITVDHITVSSSAIRTAVQAGDFEVATALLGRPFAMEGVVDHGDHIGRTIGYPTANIKVNREQMLLPSYGIFVSEVWYQEQCYGAMSYFGKRPTLHCIGGDNALRLEAFLFDFHGDMYGKEVELLFLHYLRDDVKFNSLEALKEQLKKDESSARVYLEEYKHELK